MRKETAIWSICLEGSTSRLHVGVKLVIMHVISWLKVHESNRLGRYNIAIGSVGPCKGSLPWEVKPSIRPITSRRNMNLLITGCFQFVDYLLLLCSSRFLTATDFWGLSQLRCFCLFHECWMLNVEKYGSTRNNQESLRECHSFTGEQIKWWNPGTN